MRASDAPAAAWRAATAMMACALIAGTAGAQTTSREQEQLRRLRQQVQQLQQERDAALAQVQRAGAERSTLAAELKAAQAGVGQARAGASTQARRVATLEAELAALKAGRDALQADLGRTRASLEESGTRLARSGADLAAMRSQLSAGATALVGSTAENKSLDERLDTCTAHNVALLQVGNDLLGRLGNIGWGESLATREPFLQFKRVELENLAQDYRVRIDDRRLVPPAPTP